MEQRTATEANGPDHLGHPGGRRRPSNAAVSSFFLFVLVATLPGVYLPFGAGLDPSWQYAINYLPNSGIRYGRDVIHHYGPLGFLLVTGEIAGNVPVAVCFWLAVQIVFGVLLWRFRTHFGAVAASLFAGFFLLGFAAGLWAEYQLLTLASLCYVAALLPQRRSAWFSVAGGTLCGVALMVKFSIAVGGLAATVVFTTICLFSRPRLIRPAWMAAASYLVAAVMVAWRFFPSARDFLTWTRLSSEVGAELGVAMSLAGPAAATVLAALSIAALACALVHPPAAPKATVLFFLLPLVSAFKHGFARQDGHVTAFFGLAATLAAVPFLAWERAPHRRRRMILVSAACIGSAVYSGIRFESIPQLTVAGYLHSASGLAGIEKLVSMLRLPELRRELAEQTRRNLAVVKLPSSWSDRIAAEGADIDSLPWEISLLPANGFRWTPNPAVQLLSAHTQELDLRVARHFAGGGPRMLIVSNEDPAGGGMFFEAPATWREVLAHYEPIEIDRVHQRLLLRKTAQPRLGPPQETSQQTIRFGETIEVPVGNDLLAAELYFRWSLRGVLRKSLFRVPPLRIEIQTANGRKMLLRLLPSTARDGILLRPFAADFDDFERLFSDIEGDGVVRFRLLADEVECFEADILCVWRRVKSGPTGRAQR